MQEYKGQMLCITEIARLESIPVWYISKKIQKENSKRLYDTGNNNSSQNKGDKEKENP